MNEILKTELFGLLTETSLVANNQMENAYGDFMTQIKSFIQSANDYSVVFRMLNSTRIEFMALQAIPQCEQGKKCA